jgi:hypothetical protein
MKEATSRLLGEGLPSASLIAASVPGCHLVQVSNSEGTDKPLVAPNRLTARKLDYGHGRIIKGSIWVTDADDLDFLHARQAIRIRRDRYALAEALIPKEIMHAFTSRTQNAQDPRTSPRSPTASGH